MAEETQQAEAARGKSRFPFGMYPGILSGSTRTFRDPGEADSAATNRRFSSGGHANRLAGATRTFREPELMVDLLGAKKRLDQAHPPTGGGSVAAAGNYSAIKREEEASESLVVAEEEGSPAAAIGRLDRQTSLKQWLTKKTNYSVLQTGQASEPLGGSTDQKIEAATLQEQLGWDTDGDGDKNGNPGDGEARPVNVSSGSIEATIDDFQRVGRKKKPDSYKQGPHKSPPANENFPTVGSSERITASEGQPLAHEPSVDIFDDDQNASPLGDKASRHVTFLSGTMGLTLDMSETSQPGQQEAGEEQHMCPASPCSGVILETSPRYGSLQVFRKQMALHGINAQMFHTGWKGTFLPPRDIRLFMTDARKKSVIYWRNTKKTRGQDGSIQLGAEGRSVIPLSSLANIGPAKLYQSNSAGARGPSSWLSISSPLRRSANHAYSGTTTESVGLDGDVEKPSARSGLAEVPVLALSYWVEGEPRWVGDQPKRLLLKPDSMDAFRRLTEGLRLCCLHFHNYSCPQDLEDMR